MSNIERTDTNVGNIKKDIERCEQLIKPEHANWIGISNQLSIAHLIERIKELEAKLEFKNWGDLDNTQFEEYMNHFIPKQKVKDKIEELKQKREKEPQGTVRDFILVEEIKFLKELLEEK